MDTLRNGVDLTFSEECSAIAFYGMNPSAEAVAGLFNEVSRWFEEKGYPPDKAVVSRRKSEQKWTTFEFASKKWNRVGFEGVQGIELVSLIPNARVLSRDYLITMLYVANGAWSDLNVTCRSSIAPLTRDGLLPIALKIIEIAKPAYGIGYNRAHRLGPDLYAVGISAGRGVPGTDPARDAEAEKICQWGLSMGARVWEKGLMRDVYPWNFLSRAQLDLSVGDSSLRDWIQADGQRGHLETVADSCFFWELAPIQIPSVRSALESANVIFDRKKHRHLLR